MTVCERRPRASTPRDQLASGNGSSTPPTGSAPPTRGFVEAVGREKAEALLAGLFKLIPPAKRSAALHQKAWLEPRRRDAVKLDRAAAAQ